MSKLLIINADDFGWDSDSSDAIIDLLQQQKISSTTILANCVKPGELAKLRTIESISTGLHLNLVSGQPLSEPGRNNSLTDNSGNFFSAAGLFQKFLTKSVSNNDIKNEIKAQINFLKDHGINISHADSHQHLHQFPMLGKIITQTLKENGITKIRNCHPTSTPSMRAKIIWTFAMLTRHNLAGFKSPEGLIPDFSFADLYDDPFFERILKHSFHGKNILEIMTHPGLADKPGSYLNRKQEYEFWKNTNINTLFLKYDIKLIGYHQL